MKNYVLCVVVFCHLFANGQIVKITNTAVDAGYSLVTSCQDYLVFRGSGDLLLQHINSEETYTYPYRTFYPLSRAFVRSNNPNLLGASIVEDYSNGRFLALVIDANMQEHVFEVNDSYAPLFQMHNSFYTCIKTSNGYEIGIFNVASMEWEVFYSNDSPMLSINAFNNQLYITERNGSEKIFFSLDEQAQRVNLKSVVEVDNEPFTFVGDYENGYLIKQDTLIENVASSIIYTIDALTSDINEFITVKRTDFLKIRDNHFIRREYGNLSKHSLDDLETEINFFVNGNDEIPYSIEVIHSNFYTLKHYSSGIEMGYLDEDLNFIMFDHLTQGKPSSHPEVGFDTHHLGMMNVSNVGDGEFVSVIQVPTAGKIFLAKISGATYELIAELPDLYRRMSVGPFVKCQNRYFTQINYNHSDYDPGLYEVIPSMPNPVLVQPCENNAIHEIGYYIQQSYSFPLSSNVTVFSLTADHQDNLIVAGQFGSAWEFYTDHFLLCSDTEQEIAMSGVYAVAKFDTCGNTLWTTSVGEISRHWHRSEIAVDSNGDVYFTVILDEELIVNGASSPIATGTYLLALNGQTGNLRWSKKLSQQNSMQFDNNEGHKVLVTPDDLVCVAFSSTADAIEIDDVRLVPSSNSTFNVLMAFNTDGEAKWGQLAEFSSSNDYVLPFLLLHDDYHEDIIMLSQKRSYRHIVAAASEGDVFWINRFETNGDVKATTIVPFNTNPDQTSNAHGYACDAFVNNEGKLVIIGNYTGRFNAGIVELESPISTEANQYLQTYFAIQMDTRGTVIPEVVNGVGSDIYPLKLVTTDSGERILVCKQHSDKLVFIRLDEKGVLIEKMETDQSMDFFYREYEFGFTSLEDKLYIAKTWSVPSVEEEIFPLNQLNTTVTTMQFNFEGEENLSDFTEVIVHPSISEQEPFKLFPNPSSGSIYLAYYPDMEVSELVFYNPLGQVALSIEKPNRYENISIESLPSGYYIVNITIDGSVQTFRVVKI